LKVKLKICTGGCQKPRVIWKRVKGIAWCKDCWFKTGVVESADQSKKTNVSKKRTAIPSRSPKRKKEEVLYLTMREVFLKQHPFCMMSITGICTVNATDIQHKKGRGKYYLDTRYWISGCRACHGYVTDHPKEAIELGFALPRIPDEKEENETE